MFINFPGKILQKLSPDRIGRRGGNQKQRGEEEEAKISAGYMRKVNIVDREPMELLSFSLISFSLHCLTRP